MQGNAHSLKRYRSRFLKLIAVLYLMFPLSFSVWVAFFYNVPANNLVKLLVSPWLYVVSMIAMITGLSLWEMYRASWYLFSVSNLMISVYSAWICGWLGEVNYPILAYFFSIALLGFVVYRVRMELRVPYFLPRIQWWENHTRFKLAVPAEIRRKNGPSSRGVMMDFSEKGLFFRTQDDFRLDESVTLQTQLFGKEVSVEGRVVWCTPSTVTRPKGIGVRFEGLANPQRRMLRSVVRKLHRLTSSFRKVTDPVLSEKVIDQLLGPKVEDTDADR